jgi:phosphomevalonate kinase
LRVVWTGVEARTSDFIQKVRAFEASDAVHFEVLINRLSNEAERFADAFEGGRVAAIVEQAGRYGHAMGALGEAADAPIVERSLRRVAALAREAGGAAKPSGAGGGDVAVAFFASRAAAQRFERACRAANIQILDLEIDPEGVRLEA